VPIAPQPQIAEDGGPVVRPPLALHEEDVPWYRELGQGMGPTLNVAAGLDAYVRSRIHPNAEVVLTPVEAIPRGPGGKFDPFISMVAG